MPDSSDLQPQIQGIQHGSIRVRLSHPDLAPPRLRIAELGQASLQEDRQCACVRQVRIELLIQFGSDLIIDIFPVD